MKDMEKLLKLKQYAVVQWLREINLNSYTVIQITVPHELVALMSAVKKETKEVPDDKTRVTNTFLQKVPIPSYLIAIVVGALESR